MQLLLRQPARFLDSTGEPSEVAASPDSPGRERWQWDVRLERSSVAGPDAVSSHLAGAGVGDHYVNVRFDPEVVRAVIERLVIDADDVLVRDEAELWVAVLESGRMTEGVFAVDPGDVMVWEGDDPLRIPVTALDAHETEIVLVRLRRRDGRVLRWVP